MGINDDDDDDDIVSLEKDLNDLELKDKSNEDDQTQPQHKRM